MIIGLDFDGTLVEHRFPAIGLAAPHAFEWLRRLQERGALLILYTMRSDDRADGSHPLRDAVEFCRAEGVEFWAVNENPDQASWTASPKVYAHAYVDDLALGCPLTVMPGGGGHVVDWSRVGPLLDEALTLRRMKLCRSSSIFEAGDDVKCEIRGLQWMRVVGWRGDAVECQWDERADAAGRPGLSTRREYFAPHQLVRA